MSRKGDLITHLSKESSARCTPPAKLFLFPPSINFQSLPHPNLYVGRRQNKWGHGATAGGRYMWRTMKMSAYALAATLAFSGLALAQRDRDYRDYDDGYYRGGNFDQARQAGYQR